MQVTYKLTKSGVVTEKTIDVQDEHNAHFLTGYFKVVEGYDEAEVIKIDSQES